MKKASFKLLVKAFILCFIVMLQQTSLASNLEAHWAYNYIMASSENGIIDDLQNFMPDEDITRSEFIAMLIRSINTDTLLYNYTSFTDVSVNNRYYEYIAAGESLGITTGDDKGCFNPDSYISRQDAAVLIGRAYKIPINQAFDILRYRDGIDISSYAVGYMSYMTNKKILNGFEDNTIRPRNNVSKAQTVAMICRINDVDNLSNTVNSGNSSEKIKFRRGYPSINDTGISGSFNMSFKTDKECDIYYAVTSVGEQLDSSKINNFLCHTFPDTVANAFFPYEYKEVDIHIKAVSQNDNYTCIKVIRNVVPLCFTRGSGTPKDPYIITNQQQLEAISYFPKKSFALGNDIKLSSSFKPICSSNNTNSLFSGNFDGRGHTISDFEIKSNDKFVGLFAYINGGTVKNLYVSAKTISAQNDVGIIAGENNGGTIENCFVTGLVYAENNNAGGICGTNNGIIRNCASAAAIIESSMYAGGICGINYATVESCASYSYSITSQMYAGGICALNSNGTIRSCLAANMNIDALMSSNSSRISTNLSNAVTENNYCYIGTNAFVSDGYNEKNTPHGCDATWDELFDNTFYSDKLGWDTKNTWYIPTNNDILILPSPIALGSKYTVAGLTEFTPIHISTESELYNIKDNPHLHYILMNDIRMSTPWKTICDDFDDNEFNSFTGSLNGNGKTISDITIEYSENSEMCALIGNLNGGILRNLNISNAVIEGGRYTGGFCAVNKGSIINCSFEGTVISRNTSSLTSSGGICALNYGLIDKCTSNASINEYVNSVTVGGICAYNEGNINYCSSDSVITVQGIKVMSNSVIGGITGYNVSGMISNSFSSSMFNVYSDTSYIGGICGMLDTGEVYACSSIFKGEILSAGGNNSKSYTGGICGLSNNGSILHCFSSGSINPNHITSYTGGISGYNTSALIQNTYSTAKITQLGKDSYAGGILGYNESGFVTSNAALNIMIRSDGKANRVCGNNSEGIIENNIAVTEMLVNYFTVTDSILDGKSISKNLIDCNFFFKPIYENGEMGWSSVKYDGDSGVWCSEPDNRNIYTLPILNNVPNQHLFTMPKYIAQIK